MKDPAQTAIEALGWTTQEASDTFSMLTARHTFQATQGHYRTPWLDSWAEVLRWIRGNKDKPKYNIKV
jgi:uncharacterized Fe-S cluster-containing MiaB family protein